MEPQLRHNPFSSQVSILTRAQAYACLFFFLQAIGPGLQSWLTMWDLTFFVQHLITVLSGQPSTRHFRIHLLPLFTVPPDPS